MASSTDRIEKTILLRASRERVWRAVSDAQEFGSWFGVELDGAFVAGSHLTGRIVPTRVDAEVAKAQAPHSGMAFELWVEAVEPMRRFSFRWHPFAIDPAVDYSGEPTTLVVFELEEAEGGTLAKAQAPHSGMAFELWVEAVEPMRRFSFRWHPFAIDPAVDYSGEPTTLVVFELEEAEGGTRLTITESGFDRIPLERRAKAFAANDGGWAAQAGLLEKYLADAERAAT